MWTRYAKKKMGPEQGALGWLVMNLKILHPSELKKKAAARVDSWRKAKKIAERRGHIPDYANASLVLMNRIKRVELSEEGRKKLDAALLEAANDVDGKGRDGKLRALLESGADVNVQDGNGWTPLMIESMVGAISEAMKILIDYGAEVDLQNSEGNTALHIAAEYNNPGAAEALANARATPHIKNKSGKDVMDSCVWVSNSVAFVLEEKYWIPLPPEFHEKVDEEGNPMESLAERHRKNKEPAAVGEEDAPF